MHLLPGQPVQIGVCLSYAIDMTTRWVRLVAIRHGDVKEFHRFIVREYKEGDTDFPTGKYMTTSTLGLVPHTGHGCPDGSQERHNQP
jgi:hypothetical protein